jgi:hypothetical protein
MDETLFCDVRSNETCLANVQNESDLAMARLEQLHLKFAYVSAHKPFDLLKVAGKLVTTETINRLHEITTKCKIFQRFGPPPRRVRAALPAHIVFNEEVIMDVFFCVW